MEYMAVIEKGETGYGAHVPDLPGCIAVSETREEVLALINDAIEFHTEALVEAGEPVPSPSSTSGIIEVNAAYQVILPSTSLAGARSATAEFTR